LGLKGSGQFLQEMRDVVVERRHIEPLRRRELLHLLSPLPEQSNAVVSDEQRESIEIIDL
jgi:hypothetical protein